MTELDITITTDLALGLSLGMLFASIIFLIATERRKGG